MVLALVAVLAGCAGSNQPEPLTRRELTRQVNRICRRANAQIGTIATSDPADVAARADAFAELVREQRAASRRLGDLVPPGATTTDYRRWLTQVDLILDLADESIVAIAADDPQAAIAANGQAEEIRVDADAFALSYGFTDCAQPTG